MTFLFFKPQTIVIILWHFEDIGVEKEWSVVTVWLNHTASLWDYSMYCLMHIIFVL